MQRLRVLLVLVCVSAVRADLPPFPLQGVIDQVKANIAFLPNPPETFSKAEYLPQIAGTVLQFRQFQNKNQSSVQYGRIIDPYAGMEIQYATPTFANAGALLLKEKYFNDSLSQELLIDVSLAMTAALTSLKFGQPVGDNGCAQGHCNFYTMPLMLAMESLQPIAAPEDYATWVALAKAVVPAKAYANWPHGTGNWFIVAATGEFLRYKLGFRPDIDDIIEQLAYQWDPKVWTDNGEYQDHSGCNGACNPMPYDHFPRKYFSVMLTRGYNGPNASEYWELNRRGAWTSLLLQSPWGELPTGARSSQHTWNEAVSCVTYEVYASLLKSQGDMDGAGYFKRAAMLSLNSLARWKRPTGEWWILKNRFDPELRFGYESYSYYSQYNLLPASMLATAYMYADDTIPMKYSFTEVGGYVFETDLMNKVIANAGGNYIEIELFPDSPIHDATGFARHHIRKTDPLITMTAAAPTAPEGGAANDAAIAIGPAWSFMQTTVQYCEVVSQSTPYDNRFNVRNILWSDNESDQQSGLWLLPVNATNQGFVLDIGMGEQPSPSFIAIELRNTHNDNYNDFGTKDFTISVSDDQAAWETVISAALPSAIGKGSSMPWVQFNASKPITARYLRFNGVTFYGHGVGLNGFRIPELSPRKVQSEKWGRLASMEYTDVVSTSLQVLATPNPQIVNFKVVYDLKTSATQPVQVVEEVYMLDPAVVNVSATVSQSLVPLEKIGAVFPVFLHDGERNSEHVLDSDNGFLQVQLPGDTLSQLGTSCATFSIFGPWTENVQWQSVQLNATSRNGYMQDFVAYADATKVVDATVYYLLLAEGGECSPP